MTSNIKKKIYVLKAIQNNNHIIKETISQYLNFSGGNGCSKKFVWTLNALSKPNLLYYAKLKYIILNLLN
jgi:hypothetical protein